MPHALTTLLALLLLAGCPLDVVDTGPSTTGSTGEVDATDSVSSTVTPNSTGDVSNTSFEGTLDEPNTGSTSDQTGTTTDATSTGGSTLEVTTSATAAEMCTYGVHCPSEDDCPAGQVCATEFGTLPVCVSPCGAGNDCAAVGAQCDGLSLHCAPDARDGTPLCFPDL